MVNISIFAKPATLHKIDKHLLRGSSIIRGEQVASQIGAKLNPEKGFNKDICIYIKPNTQKLYRGEIKLAKKSHIDIIDSDNLVLYVKKHPEIQVIACSRENFEYMKRKLKNEVILIPQHHCNFERIKRNRIKITTVGAIGTPDLLSALPKNLEGELGKHGLTLIKYSGFRSRMDVSNFYQKIDIQIVWRPWKKSLSNPLKIINAASFGIPTVAFDENSFNEVSGCYIPVKSPGELIEQIVLLKTSPKLYSSYRDKCLKTAEDYHIEQISKLYKNLKTI